MPTPDTTLVLGNITFQELEIPANISWGGEQMLAVHKLVGGKRTIDAMGRDDKPLTWTGLFFGPNATARAAALDAMRISGLPQTLSWGNRNYTVVVRSFDPDYHRAFEIPYSITCEVDSDNVTPTADPSATSTDNAINDDLGTAEALTTLLKAQAQAAQAQAIAALQSLMSQVATAISAVNSFVGAPPSVIASVLTPLVAAQIAVEGILTSSDASIAAAPGFAGLVGGGFPPSLSLALTGTLGTAQQEITAVNLSSVLGRMAANLNSANLSPNSVALSGGDLFSLASSVYGDATDWTIIATANGLTDPFISGPEDLTLPLIGGDSSGILNA